MSELEGLWLGVVQGLTEFFPVSSSGHLVMLQTIMGVESEGGIAFEVALHVATVGAIVLFYRARVASLVLGALRGEREAWLYAGKLALATLPAVAVGLYFEDAIAAQFARPAVAGVGLLLTGAILWSTRSTLPRAHLREPGFAAALAIGVAQTFAFLPGVSRSGTTVAVALALGIAPLAAAEFSFLMGVIAITGAAVLTLPEFDSVSGEYLGALTIGCVAALLSGIAALWFFVKLLQSQRFYLFSFYAWPVGASFLVWLSLRG